MPDTIRDFVMEQPLFDTHAHLSTYQDFAEQPHHFTSFISYGMSDIKTAEGPQPLEREPLENVSAPGYTSRFFEAWRHTRASAYARAIERAVRDLLGLEFVEENAEAIGKRLADLKGDNPSAWFDKILGNANIISVINDCPANMPGQVADGIYPAMFRFAYRDDDLLALTSRDDIFEREVRWNRSILSLDDLVEGLMQSITDCLSTGRFTSFKMGLAYRRGLRYDEPTKHEAEKTFIRLMNTQPETPHRYKSSHMSAQSLLSGKQLQPLQNYLIHQVVRRAADENLGVEMHTGYVAGWYNDLRNINPIELVPLLKRYPRARFDLFHAGWPYQEILGAIGKHYANVWLNLCWAWSVSPIATARALDTWLDCVPHCKILAFGSDTFTPIALHGFALQAREGIARVLQQKIDRAEMDISLAQDVARAIMLENGQSFHRLS